jgi:hypothetical protein
VYSIDSQISAVPDDNLFHRRMHHATINAMKILQHGADLVFGRKYEETIHVFHLKTGRNFSCSGKPQTDVC